MEDQERTEEAYLEDDHIAQLSRSHKKTLRMLEEDVYSNDDSEERKPSSRDPQGQIFPSSEEIAAEAFSSRRRDTFESRQARTGQNTSVPVMAYGNFSKFISDKVKSSHAAPESKGGSPRRRLGRKHVAILVVSMAAMVATTVVLAIPKTRNALEDAVSTLTKDAETALTHSSNRQMILPVSELGSLRGSNLADYRGLYSPVYNSLDNVVPVLWDIQNSGSETSEDIMAYCMRLILSDDRGETSTAESTLSIKTTTNQMVHYVDVDTSTLEGLERADQLGLVESGLADIITTPYMPQAAELFRSKIKTGRLFAILRHPVERGISMYNATQANIASSGQQVGGNQTLYDYALSDLVEENIMVKTLANITNGIVTSKDVDVARTVLHHFVIVGLSGELEESMERFYDYFGWAREDGYQECQRNHLALRQPKEDIILDEDGVEYMALAGRNWADMLLWESVKQVWEQQGKIDGSVN